MYSNFTEKKICLVSDCFIPTKNSASGMMYNLVYELKKEGSKIICVHGGLNPNKDKDKEKFKGYDILGIKFITTNFLSNFRSKNLYKRLVFEIALSLVLSFKILINKNEIKNLDLIIWYGPSAFLWLPVLIIKLISKTKVLYIVRDLFPEWMVSIGLIKKNIVFYILKFLTYPQFLIPNCIGVESKKSINLIKNIIPRKRTIMLIYNWPSLNKNISKSIFSEQDLLILRKIKIQNNKYSQNYLKGIYIGNSGHAQDLENNLIYFSKLTNHEFINLNIFSPNKKKLFKPTELRCILWPGINDYILPSLIKNSDFGIVSLHNRLFSHNLPGKFVSYLQFGIPVLSFSNKNSEISNLISSYQCGEFIDVNDSLKLNEKKIQNFINTIKNNRNFYPNNCYFVFNKFFNYKNLKFEIEKFF